MRYGSPYSEDLIKELSDTEIRKEYVADQVRTKIALAIRTLREQPGRVWSQSELGKKCGKPQSVISRIEDPDYGRYSLETLLEVAHALGVPLRVDFPEWGEWFVSMKEISSENLYRRSWDTELLLDPIKDQPTRFWENSLFGRSFSEVPAFSTRTTIAASVNATISHY